MNISNDFHKALEQMQVAHTWHVDNGGHTWAVWKNDLYLFSQLLFQDTGVAASVPKVTRNP
ncbi:MAG: hypothetical protein ACYC3X_03205 [Pirellulaceae bacterium]